MTIAALARFAAVTLVLAAIALPARAADDPRNLMSVTGTGEVSAAPDMAIVSIGVVSQARTARDALDENTAAMGQVLQVLKDLGLADKDLQTRGFSVDPRYHHDNRNNKPPQLVGYQVRNSVQAKVRDLTGLGRVLDSVVSEGSNQINGLTFTFDDPENLMDEARRLAGADARRKAELYAEGLDVTLGEIVAVSEAGAAPRPPQPVLARAAAMEAAVPIAVGEQTLRAQLTVTWEIEN